MNINTVDERNCPGGMMVFGMIRSHSKKEKIFAAFAPLRFNGSCFEPKANPQFVIHNPQFIIGV